MTELEQVQQKYQVNLKTAKKIIAQRKLKQLIKELDNNDRYKEILDLIAQILL
jgi:hypothetical protein